jgi:formimidoylglutamate deiminase
MRLFAREAFLPDGWAPDVLIDVAPDGTIVAVRGGSPQPRDAELLDGPVLPGMPNLHSHAFQRAMAGTAERRGASGDDFWSWREAMYALAARLEPDTLYAIAHGVYRAMLVAGYTAVAEFHYLHRDPRGAWYADKAATSRALIAAAKDAGIAICLLPALYAHGDAGGAPLQERQRRFATQPDDVLEIAAALRRDFAGDPDVVAGACAHSLRAVTPDELRALVDGSPRDVPMHLHAAEQMREVAAEGTLGARPVAWLLANHDVGPRWCLVHATHLDDAERAGLARSGAVAGLAPTTEANLGDGFFPLGAYRAEGGSIGIGSDSNVSVSPPEELRWLEYGQRLAAQRRVVAATDAGASCGETLYATAAAGGARACGFAAGALRPGLRADLVVLDARAERLAGAPPEELLDRYVFASDRAAPRHVMVRGHWRVRDGVLVAEEAERRAGF